MSSDNNKKLTSLIPPKNISLMREVPMNIGAEQALLGAILSNNQAFEKIKSLI